MENTTTRRGFVKGAAAGAAGLAALSALRTQNANADEAAYTVPFGDMWSRKANARQLTDDLWWVGASDSRIALFENVYPLEHGVAYNSYLLLDEDTVLFDTVDRAVAGQYFENVSAVLDGRDLDYLVVHHMEPDHSYAISQVMGFYPNCKVVCSAMAAQMISNFFGIETDNDRFIIVAEGDTLTTGTHTLAFVEAPMVHWPEVIMSFDATTGTLFSADAFGSFNALDGNMYADQVNFQDAWLDEARRYYCNIVGKYGPQVQDVLAKAATLDISMVCATHGPVWRDDLGWYIDKYDKWSSYTPEDDAVVIFYGSIYGNTENAANILASKLSEAGVDNVKVYDVSKTHVSWLIAECFRASHLVFASATYNMGIFTPMKNFLNDLVAHNMQNRHVSFVGNGSWSPVAPQLMEEIVDQMADMTKVGETVTITSGVNDEDAQLLSDLAAAIAASVAGEDAPVASDAAEEAAGTRQWKCSICGYIYEGDELPEDYTCPICGQPASVFEEITE
jgi:flavorubredoxin/rubredoxin